MSADNELSLVRARILRIMDLNPHTYHKLQSYRVAIARERELVATLHPRGPFVTQFGVVRP